MTVTRTVDQVLALAPDPSGAKSGRELGVARKWLTLGTSATHIWGECQGSGSQPYQTQVDLEEPAFKCSCPSRKFPCKHGLGLMLVHAQEGNQFKSVSPPEWVAAWIASRQKSAEKKARAADKPDKAPDPVAQAKRAASRETKIADGMDELRQWLGDVVRNGISDAPSQPWTVWEGVAARMVDAQAPGVARFVRDLGGTAHSGEGWQDRMTEKLGMVFLLSEAFRNREQLPDGLKSDLRTWIGINVPQDEVLATPPVRDHWMVVGQRTEDDGRLKTQRTWLRGLQPGRVATVLAFAVGQQTLDASFGAGSIVDAELCFFPGSWPVRALLKTRHATISPRAGDMPGYSTIDAAFQDIAKALSANPWLAWHGIPLTRVTPTPLSGNRWALRDDEGSMLPVSPRSERMWTLLAISGGEPISVFGEWDGETILPLSSLHAGHFLPL